MAEHERRRHKRYKVNKPVKIRGGTSEQDGRLTDISSSGAAINADEAESPYEDDQELELELEDFGVLSGSVVRTLDDGFAMSFDLDEEGEELLISEITGFQAGSDYE
ncbi:MAG: hypothetical protein GKS00_09555 [Alphaproteobacteria bacterium]|nr:hypothetical protein [Alphaproteobacteria bacterium]